MASAPPLKDIDKQFLKCSRCHNWLKEPKLLPCLHRYCRDCLKKIVKKEDEKIRCPTCREEHDLPENGVDGLKTDYNSNNIVEFFKLQDSVKHEPLKVCINCSKKLKVTAFCFKCDDFLCQKCHEHHMTNRVMTDHQPHIFSLNESEVRNLTIEKLCSLKQAPRCYAHPKKLSELCCTTCSNMPICIACTYGAHQGHKLKEVKALAEIEREKLTKQVDDLMQYKEKIYKMQGKIMNTMEKFNQTVDEKRHRLQEQLNIEERKFETAISNTDERLEKQQNQLEEKVKIKESSKTQMLKKEMIRAKEKYEKAYKEERQEADAGLRKLQKESEKDKAKLQKVLDTMNKKIKNSLTSLNTQEEENTKKINELSNHLDSIVKRFENVTTMASIIVSAKHHWTDIQCIPDICKAIDPLIKEIKRGYPGLKTLSDITLRGLSSVITVEEDSVIDNEGERFIGGVSSVATGGRVNAEITEKEDSAVDDKGVRFIGGLSSIASGGRVKVDITEKQDSVVDITGVRYITGITGSKDGSIIITGCTSSGHSYIRVINMKGEQLRQDIIKTATSYQRCYCDSLSQFKVATVSTPNEIGIYDIRDGTYRKINIKDVTTSRWPAGWDVGHVLCVAADPAKNHIFVGGENSRDVYVFNGELQYIRTLVLPQMIEWPRDMTVHKGNLLVCDYTGKKAWAMTMEGREAKMVYELPTPKLEGAWSPLSVCTDSNNLIYMMWLSRSGPGRNLTQYSQDGCQLLTTRRVDDNAWGITTIKTDKGDKLLIALFSKKKLYTFGLITGYNDVRYTYRCVQQH